MKIQAFWRGFVVMKFKMPKIRRQAKIENKIRSFVKAWKIRHIMQTRDIITIRASLRDIDKMIEEFKFLNATTSDKNINFSQNQLLISQFKSNRRSQVEHLVKTIEKLYKNGAWVCRFLSTANRSRRGRGAGDDGAAKE